MPKFFFFYIKLSLYLSVFVFLLFNRMDPLNGVPPSPSRSSISNEPARPSSSRSSISSLGNAKKVPSINLNQGHVVISNIEGERKRPISSGGVLGGGDSNLSGVSASESNSKAAINSNPLLKPSSNNQQQQQQQQQQEKMARRKIPYPSSPLDSIAHASQYNQPSAAPSHFVSRQQHQQQQQQEKNPSFGNNTNNNHNINNNNNNNNIVNQKTEVPKPISRKFPTDNSNPAPAPHPPSSSASNQQHQAQSQQQHQLNMNRISNISASAAANAGSGLADILDSHTRRRIVSDIKSDVKHSKDGKIVIPEGESPLSLSLSLSPLVFFFYEPMSFSCFTK